MKNQLGGEYAAYLRAMEERPSRALRVNTLKIAPEEFEQLADFPLTPIPDCSGCYQFPDDVPIGRHPLHLAGLIYVQEPSAQQPARLLAPRPGMTVLDLCAAPGGKAGQLAAMLNGSGLLIANEPAASRTGPLQFNLERLGVANAIVTSQAPEPLCAALSEQCDQVLVDAPCSGEGMFRREPAAIQDWSTGHVQACARRQTEILRSAANAVKPGGVLVYSTCTFSPEENEAVVDAFVAEHPDFTLNQTQRLYPHTFPGEGQFMALLCRAGEPQAIEYAQPPKADLRAGNAGLSAGATPQLGQWDRFCKEFLLQTPVGHPTLLPDGRVFLQPPAMMERRVGAGLRMLRAGVLAGEFRNDRFTPAHALFMALPAQFFRQQVPIHGDLADAFLRGETIPCQQTLSGWCAVTYDGYSVGFGKAVNGTLKNHLPKGLRRLG